MQPYDNKKSSKYITYLDPNKLYGWAMRQYLPYDGVTWLNKKWNDKFVVNSTGENSSDGYILEVDLEYCDELHELYNGFPLAPEKRKINHDMLPYYCSNIANNYKINLVMLIK